MKLPKIPKLLNFLGAFFRVLYFVCFLCSFQPWPKYQSYYKLTYALHMKLPKNSKTSVFFRGFIFFALLLVVISPLAKSSYKRGFQISHPRLLLIFFCYKMNNDVALKRRNDDLLAASYSQQSTKSTYCIVKSASFFNFEI